MAALRRSIVTCKELGHAIGLKEIALRNEVPRVPAESCYGADEPPLTALMVNAQTGEPGAGRRGTGKP
ncbi:hypothetical protein [Amycolatopsis sp. NBC_01286]|uniref:hypothetical protein n=1 Tax=Amycolatopsis sp. NBC_01286 TaxID=2903560 RepID=UPI002E0E1929|nr:hypothetical protein OG570_23845 [Amycolatopsis sp. NBC_01286]